MYSYLNLLEKLVRYGKERQTRNAVTYGLFGETMEFNLQSGFPILTTKKMAFRAIAAEMLGFLKGYTNSNSFEQDGCNVWRANADDPRWRASAAHDGSDGDLGRIYGAQWRDWRTHHPILKDPGDEEGPYLIDGWQSIDQIRRLVDTIERNPTDRRMVVSAWNPGELDEMCLPPCHLLFQVYCDGPYMDLQMYQRSVDVFLGLPFNISGYALLLWVLAKSTGHEPRTLRMCLGDVHLYSNHVEQVHEQISRTPQPLPDLQYNLSAELTRIQPWHFQANLFELVGYDPHPPIKAEMIV